MKKESDSIGDSLPLLKRPNIEQEPSGHTDVDFKTIAYEEFAPDAGTIARVRQFVHIVLETYNLTDEQVFACALIADELATNALTYAGSFYSVAIELSATSVRIAVRDDSQNLPVLREYSVDAETGRGLSIVAKESTEWGAEFLGLGKETWADVAAEPDPSKSGG